MNFGLSFGPEKEEDDDQKGLEMESGTEPPPAQEEAAQEEGEEALLVDESAAANLSEPNFHTWAIVAATEPQGSLRASVFQMSQSLVLIFVQIILLVLMVRQLDTPRWIFLSSSRVPERGLFTVPLLP